MESTKISPIEFYTRMIGWITVQLIAPITTFGIKFGLFTKTGYEVSVDELGNVVSEKTALNGWGIISVLIIGFTAIEILKTMIESSGPGYTLQKQVLNGIKSRLLPIVICLVIFYWLDGVIDNVIFCLTILAICQAISIFINPLPKWKACKLGSECYDDLLTNIVKMYRSKHTKGGTL